MAPHPETKPVLPNPHTTLMGFDAAPYRPCEDENGNPACRWYIRQRISHQDQNDMKWSARFCTHPNLKNKDESCFEMTDLVMEECTAFDPITKED